MTPAQRGHRVQVHATQQRIGRRLDIDQAGFGPQDGNYRVKPHIQHGVTFRQLNLLEGSFPFTDLFHLIFCRNVMIYFDRATQEELVHKLMQRLVPGGYLFVGHSESLSGIKHGFETIKPAIYRRPLA